MQSGKEKTVFIFEAEEGMILARDVYSPGGHMIVPQGVALTHDLINTIADNHILEILIYDGIQGTDTEPTYFDKLRATPEFTKFTEEYNGTVSTVKNNLNDIVFRDKEIDVSTLIADTDSILSGSRSNLQVFDMLHSLRKNDDLTYVHCVNVSLIATIIGRWLNMSEDDLNVLSTAALLHDIGKIMIPNEILTKPGKLTVAEYNIMKQHVNFGYEKVKNQNIDIRIKEACLLHHEKCDGTGYPFGLKSDQIPAVAKIIAIADVYDAMTSARVYRGALCPFEVIDTMYKDAFTKFEPEYILPFLKNVASSYINNDVRLSDGRIGKVVLINENALSLPIVQCEDEFIDLSKTRGLTVSAIL